MEFYLRDITKSDIGLVRTIDEKSQFVFFDNPVFIPLF